MGMLTRFFSFWMPHTHAEPVALTTSGHASALGVFARKAPATSGGRAIRHAGAQMQETAQAVEQLCEQMRDVLRRIDAQMDVRARRDPQILDALDAFEQMRQQLTEWHLQHEQVQSAMEDAERLCRDTLDAQRIILAQMGQREESAGERHMALMHAIRRIEDAGAPGRPESPVALLPESHVPAAPGEELAHQLARTTRLLGFVSIGAILIASAAVWIALG